MDAGKPISTPGAAVAAVAATRPVAATEVIGLLTPKGGLTATDRMLPSPQRAPSDPATSSRPVAPTVAQLSPGAQLLLKLLATGTASAQPLQAARPLMDAPPDLFTGGTATKEIIHAGGTAAGAEIARALQAGLEHSGLFYESHLADWVGGGRSLEAIRAEPQALLQSEKPASAAGNGSAIDHDALTGATTSAAISSIVHAQLDTIDSGQLRWQGELWPGVPAEIQLQRAPRDRDTDNDSGHRSNEGQGDDAAGGHRWQARLITTLPALGKISTQFLLQDERLELKLSCAERPTTTALKAASPQLAETLHGTGIALQGFFTQLDNTCDGLNAS